MLEGSQIEIVPCGPSDLAELRVIGLQSFTEAFAAQNKPSDFEAYVSGAFDPAVLERELLVGASEFYFSKIDGRTAGYLKVNRLFTIWRGVRGLVRGAGHDRAWLLTGVMSSRCWSC